MCLTFSRPSKESDVSMGRNPVPASRPVLWSCFSPICFQKTPKDLHGPFKKDRDTHSNLFGQHVDIGRTREETIALRDTLILLLQCLGMVINQKKSVITPVQEIEFLGMIVNSKEITEKTTINKRDVSGFVSESKDNSFRVNKGVRPPDINSFGHSPSKAPLSFSPATTNSGTEFIVAGESQVLLNQESQLELLWWVKKIEIYNGRT